MTPSLWQSFLSVITFYPLQPFCLVFFPVGASKTHDLRLSVSCQEHLHAQYQTDYLSRFSISLVSEPDHMTVSSYYCTSFLIFPIHCKVSLFFRRHGISTLLGCLLFPTLSSRLRQ